MIISTASAEEPLTAIEWLENLEKVNSEGKI